MKLLDCLRSLNFLSPSKQLGELLGFSDKPCIAGGKTGMIQSMVDYQERRNHETPVIHEVKSELEQYRNDYGV